MNIPAHIEPIRGSVLLGECDDCGDATDLKVEHPPASGRTVWRCWECQGLPDIHVTQKCTSAAAPRDSACGLAWFVGPKQEKPRCPTCDPSSISSRPVTGSSSADPSVGTPADLQDGRPDPAPGQRRPGSARRKRARKG